MNDEKKRVLMFCVSFFGYEKRIADAIRDEGYEVDLYDERPSNSFLAKTCIRYNVASYRPAIRRYVQSIIKKCKDKKYDYVLVVKGEAMNDEVIDLLRGGFSDAKFVLYLWDSVKNIPECKNRMKRYDRVFTFDPEDAKKYDITFLPIPYGKEYTQYECPGEYVYDIAFIGTAHSIRPRVINQIREQCAQNSRKMYVYFYSPHPIVFLLNKLTNPNFRCISFREVHFTSLSTEEVCRIYSMSKCVLDIEHPKQNGTTTRPVEMLPMRKKIITTNTMVDIYPFYNENNFCIIDRNNPIIDCAFLDKAFIPVEEQILFAYSGHFFVENLLKS